MNRRSFLGSIVSGTVTPPLLAAQSPARAPDPGHRAFAMDGNQVRFFSAATRPFRMFVLADTHLFLDDARGEPYAPFSQRMAGAYNQTKHFQTGQPTNPAEGFDSALDSACQAGAELIALVGDIFSFPSEAAVEWALSRLKATGIPYIYVAGNHDWHYEGMAGTLDSLRSTWCRNRLHPLFQGRDPLMTWHDLNGIRLIFIDNSTYEIQPGQLKFLRRRLQTRMPCVLFVHIPLYAPGRGVGFGCGHPEWSAASDRNHALERRPQWPERGHTATTMEFHRTVFSARNLLGVFAGHIHKPSLDLVRGIPQFVTDANATGAFLQAEFIPAPARRTG